MINAFFFSLQRFEVCSHKTDCVAGDMGTMIVVCDGTSSLLQRLTSSRQAAFFNSLNTTLILMSEAQKTYLETMKSAS